MRGVGQAKTLFWPAEHISIELVVFVLVVNGDHAVIARREMLPHHRGLPFTRCDGSGAVAERFVYVFRPALGRDKDRSAHNADGVAQSVHMNSQRAILRRRRSL